MRRKLAAACDFVFLAVLAAFSNGCGNTGSLFNPAFINTFQGGVFPLTPGPPVAFILVRVLNDTGQTAEFTVTIEQLIIETDEDGNFLYDDAGNPITRAVLRTKQLFTSPNAPANDLGVLFDCSVFPVTRIGLGENLLPTDAGVFIGGEGPAGSPGFGISAGQLNPLSLEAGNFNCGDTVIFQAFQSTGVPGGVSLQSYILPHSEQPSEFQGPSTFENYEALLESQVREEEP